MDAAAVLRWCIGRPRDIEHWDEAIRVVSCKGLYASLSGRLPLGQRIGAWAVDAIGLMSATEVCFVLPPQT
jgi:hypothetical protein